MQSQTPDTPIIIGGKYKYRWSEGIFYKNTIGTVTSADLGVDNVTMSLGDNMYWGGKINSFKCNWELISQQPLG